MIYNMKRGFSNDFVVDIAQGVPGDTGAVDPDGDEVERVFYRSLPTWP